MSWLPEPTVTIAGQDYTGRTIGQVRLNRGRDTVYATPSAGFASVELIDVTQGSLGFQVGAELIITVENSTSTPVRLFTGIVSDWVSNVVATGGEPVVTYQVEAVGPLAILNRRNVLFTGRPQETDGQRVLAAITEGLPVTWEEYSLTQTWEQAGDVTWEGVDPGFNPDLIDPGVYNLIALGTADAGYSALTVATEAGQSAKGLLFETADGFIGYADADRRPANAGDGPLQVPYAVLSIGGLSTSSSLADLTNRITVEYGTDDDAVTLQDDFSLTNFGLQETRLRTLLASESDADARADDFLFAHSRPAVELQELVINLRGPITDTLRDNLLAINSNDYLQVTGLPAKLGFGPSGFFGYVEGIRIAADDFRTEISLLVSDELLSFGSVLWGQVTATIAWEDVDAALTWADARRVTT